MAAAAACKQLAQLRRSSGIAITQFSNSSLRSFSQLGRKPEGQGVPTKTQVQSSQGHPLDLLHHDLELEKMHHDLEKLRNKTNELEKVRNEYRELVKKRNPMQDNYMELSDEIEATRRDIKYWIGTFTSVYVVVSVYVFSIEWEKPGGSTNSSTQQGASSQP